MASLKIKLFYWLLSASVVSAAQVNEVQVSVGANVTLRCARADDVNTGARLYWYKQSPGQKPEQISSFFRYDLKSNFHRDFQNDTRFTVENVNDRNDLTIMNVSVSDSGVYHCISCFLYQSEFLESTTVTVKSLSAEQKDLSPPCSVVWLCVYTASGASGLGSVLIALLIFCLCRKTNADASMTNPTTRTKSSRKLLQYTATDHTETSRGRGQMDETWSGCVYFNVKQ